MLQPLLVFVGGGLGAVARFGLSRLIAASVTGSFPWPTLTINLLGALCIGLFAGFEEMRGGNPPLRLFLVTGMLGGFTTFSAFSLESALLYQRGAYVNLGLYLGLSMLGTMLLVFAGSALMRHIG